MQALFFGTYHDGVHPRVRVLREGLVASGLEVREHNVRLGLSTADRVAMLERPALLPRLLLRLAMCWWRLVVLRVRDRPRPDVVVVGYLGHFDVLLARLLYPRRTIVLDYLIAAADTARDRRQTRRALLRILDTIDRCACAAADVVLVDTPNNVATVSRSHRPKAISVPVGAPEHWFTAPPDVREASPLRAVFFGLFTPLQGAPVILEALRLAADRGRPIAATVIGTGQDHERAAALGPDDVTWLDWVEPDQLPAIVADHDLCFGIFGEGPKARRVVPNKAFQGAAAGCLVVTSDTEPQRRALPSVTVFSPPGDADALADALVALPSPEEVLDLRRRSHAEATARFSPTACVTPLLQALHASGDVE